MAVTKAAPVPPSRRAPDLARLPITVNPRAMSLVEGARAALSVAVIIAIGQYFDLLPLREAALGALLTCLTDPGGPIGRRVPVLLSFAALGALATCVLGLVRGLGIAVALPVGVLALFATSFARVYGQAGQQLGTLLGTVVILSLDRPMPDLATAATLAGAFAGGAAWATLLTLVIWRIHPFLPARRAVAEAYRALAAQATDLTALLRAGVIDDATWEAHARRRRRAVREAIESARAANLAVLRARGAASARATQCVIRLEAGDQIFGALIALSDLLEHGSTIERRVALRMLRRIRALLLVLGRITVTDEANAHPHIRRTIDAMEAEIPRLPPGDALQPIARRVVERLRIAHTLAVPGNLRPGTDEQGRVASWPMQIWGPLRANLDWRSLTLRHALRTALMAAPALAFTMIWFNPYDHWLTITIVATMQPIFALTFVRAIERVLGTALGGVIAALVGLFCTTPLAMAAAMFPLAMAALMVRAVSFGLFMAALTPLIVLLVEIGEPGTAEWTIAAARASFTVLGGVIAVAASFVLWPQREPEQLPREARSAIAAHGRYAEAALGGGGSMDLARRAAGLATNTLEAAITRALIEAGRADRERLEAALVVDAALRRFAGRLLALTIDPSSPMASGAWQHWIVTSMLALAAGRSDIASRPAEPASDGVLRLGRQVELMAGAMERLSAGGHAPIAA